jgi:c-di-AMP phosphodiesterase-like protein
MASAVVYQDNKTHIMWSHQYLSGYFTKKKPTHCRSRQSLQVVFQEKQQQFTEKKPHNNTHPHKNSVHTATHLLTTTQKSRVKI